MELKFKKSPDATAVAYLCTEGKGVSAVESEVDAPVFGILKRAATSARFEGKSGQLVEILAPAGSDADRILLVGLGKDDELDARAYEKAGAVLVKKLLTSGVESLDIAGCNDAESGAQIAFGARLAAYRYDGYRTVKEDQKPTLATVGIVTSKAKKTEEAYAVLAAEASGVETARDLVNMPPNDLHPESYAERIRDLSELGLEIDILDETAMEKLGMHALLGVGEGSEIGSRLAVMKWMGADDKSTAPLALVGKGVTFDTGGISLKPGPGMEDMKGDMGGSAAVVGAMVAIASRKAKANVIGLVGLVENMPDGRAQRPGDVVKSASGQTIEILNTDAEGRLVLCDVLWYAQDKYKPSAIIDLATLTGAIVVSLGHEHGGMFSNNDDLAAKIDQAGKASGETVWRLPLGAAYDKKIDSKIADMKNIGGRDAGSITAAQFLQRFIQNDTPWAHLDIAGTAWKPGNTNPMEPGWASGFGVRLLDRLVKDEFEG